MGIKNKFIMTIFIISIEYIKSAYYLWRNAGDVLLYVIINSF